MPKTCCCVPGCHKRGGHRFPTNEEVKKRWVIAIKRVGERNTAWTPTRESVVCSDHFVDSDYIQVTTFGTSPVRKQLKGNAVPSVFPWKSSATECSVSRSKRLGVRNFKKLESSFCSTTTSSLVDVSNSDSQHGESINDVAIGCEFDAVDELTWNNSISPSRSEHDNGEVESKPVDISTQTSSLPILCVERFMFDDSGMLFYTGLSSYTDFKFVLACLGEAAYHLNYVYNRVDNLSVENQLFLTLIRLRQHKTIFELSRLFAISETCVNNIWITWVNFMALQWREVDIWPCSDTVRYFSPSDFRRKFPTTRVVVDGTECPVKKPRPPIAQQATYSTYKNRNTVKILVGATPGGLLSYISPAYGGSVSDRQIVERSNLVQMCEPGDSLMADKGFNVQDLFATRDVTINIPAFFRKKNRLTSKIVLRDRKISSKRVHIERLIGLAKTFKILSSPLNATETKLASEITFICFMLCNFRPCIVPRHA